MVCVVCVERVEIYFFSLPRSRETPCKNPFFRHSCPNDSRNEPRRDSRSRILVTKAERQRERNLAYGLRWSVVLVGAGTVRSA